MQPFTRLPPYSARVRTHTAAIIHPDNRTHFHEKGERGESERGGLSICRAMWLPGRAPEIHQGERSHQFWWLLTFLIFELSCSFVRSAIGRSEGTPSKNEQIPRKSPSGSDEDQQMIEG